MQGEFAKNHITFRIAGVYAPNRNPKREIFYSYIEDLVDPAKPPYYAGTLMRCSIALLTAGGPTLLTMLMTVAKPFVRLHPTEHGFSWCK